MSLPSLKKEIISGFVGATTLGKLELPSGGTADFSDNQVVVFTSGCMITGRPVDDDEEKAKVNEDNTFTIPFTSFIVNVTAKSYRKEHSLEGPLAGHDGCIVLRDATVRYASDFVIHTPESLYFMTKSLLCPSVSKIDEAVNNNASVDCRSCTANTRAAISLCSPLTVISSMSFFSYLCESL